MLNINPNGAEPSFKAAPGGWIFRSPTLWIFGDTPHYPVNDAQKATITALLTPR